jgi:hypothetical protein
VLLGQAEQEIAQKFVEAADLYARSPAALQLRAMNIIYETTKERGADGKRPAEIVRRVAVAGVTMGMIMPGMIVVSVIVRHSASMSLNSDLYSATNFEYYYRRES